MKIALGRWWLFFTLLITSFNAISANPAPTATPATEIPEILLPWKGWVLKGHEAQLCPVPYNSSEVHFCVWPTSLNLTVGPQKAPFVMKLATYNEGWVFLPGSKDYWPQDVKVNNKAYPTGTYQGMPAVFLPMGEFTIEGILNWDRVPDFIQIPPNTGTLIVSLNDKVIDQPDRDKLGRVWLGRQNQANSQPKAQDALNIKVYRLLKDGIPVEQTTLLRLQVSGQPREIVVGPVLQPNTLPLRIDSALPARLEENGLLRLQIKPGTWEITIVSRYLANQETFPFQPLPLPWPKEEIWSFSQQSELRLVDIQGAQSIDPQQTDMPMAWKEFPAYLLDQGKTLKLIEMRRGQEVRRAEQLGLQRKMWLDFSGKGFTLQDTMIGLIEQHWRLRQLRPYQLGRVTIDGQDKLITQVDAKDPPGVEIRQGQLNMTTVSRINEVPFRLPAVGWDVNVQSLSAQLFLPPGWMLVGAWGVDVAKEAWVQKWTLLDFFLVLVISAATLKLLGWRWGLVALFMMILTYQERGAPIYTWLNLIVALALLSVLPETSKAKRWVVYYFRVSFVYLLILALPFMAIQIRNAIYPQLTLPNAAPMMQSYGLVGRAGTALPQVAMEAMNAPLGKQKMFAGAGANASDAAAVALSTPAAPAPLEDYDPNAKLQTGPGVPLWSWNQYTLAWNGPVSTDQKLTLWMLSAKVTSVLKVLQVLLMFAFLYALFRSPGTSLKDFHFRKEPPALLNIFGVFLLAGLCLSVMPKRGFASDIPDQALLTELRERLLEPPSCLPECADISRMQVEVSAANLTLRFKANISSSVAIPIPSTLEKWVPRTVLVDNVVAKSLQYDANQQLWLQLPEGVHDIVMEGLIGEQDKFDIGIPLKPKEITQQGTGWTIEGINRRQLQGDHLYFNRVKETQEATKTQPTLQANRIPPFVILTKVIKLGLEWEVINEVVRVAPRQGAIEIRIPLLKGEAVLSDNIEVKDGNAWITMSAHENQIRWRSKLPFSSDIQLSAVKDPSLKQIWYVDAISQWHLTFAGIPTVHQSNQANQWLPRFEPWNGETLTIQVVKPQPVPGNTVTIDDSRLILTPGKRLTEGYLAFTARASEGGAHVFTIPPQAVLQDLLINGLSQPINAKQGTITVPLNPGTQKIEVRWQNPEGISTFYRTAPVNLQMKSSNQIIDLGVSKDRWILFLGGPVVGPAVLFWGILAVFVAGSLALGRSKLTPLRSWEWFLLAIGLTIVTPMAMIIVMAWFIAMNKRKDVAQIHSKSTFQSMQVGLILLTVVFIVSLFTSISDGLLGIPEMQLAAPLIDIVQSQFYLSDRYQLQWYQDISQDKLASAWLISVPMYIYRTLMLLWALWLAFSLVKWMRWGWECFSTGGYWKDR